MSDGTLVWAYGVVPGDQAAPDVSGVEGRPVHLVVQQGLGALVGAVPSDRFSAEALRRRLEDLDTLAELARAHDAVLEAALEHGDVVPFRLCTLYEAPEAVRDMLSTEADRFTTELARLHDKSEWGVKGFALPRAGESPPGRPATGAEYLARRREQRRRAESSNDELDGAAAEVHACLAARAAAAVASRPQDRRLSGSDLEMVLNGAYLVARDRADAFAGEVLALRQRHADSGLALELTGPWPPYHFVSEPES
jgi:hypothetical protein